MGATDWATDCFDDAAMTAGRCADLNSGRSIAESTRWEREGDAAWVRSGSRCTPSAAARSRWCSSTLRPARAGTSC